MMKKMFPCGILLYLLFGGVVCRASEASLIPLIVYVEQGSAEHRFFPSIFLGDEQDLLFDEGWETGPVTGKTCIRVAYAAAGDFGWAGMYWVNPAGSFGEERGGFDLRAAKKLTFWAKGEKGGEHVAVFRFGGIKNYHHDSDIHGIGPVTLSNEWQQYEIDVSQRNLKYISAGFGFCIAKAANRQGAVFYIDDIRYE